MVVCNTLCVCNVARLGGCPPNWDILKRIVWGKITNYAGINTKFTCKFTLIWLIWSVFHLIVQVYTVLGLGSVIQIWQPCLDVSFPVKRTITEKLLKLLHVSI